MRRYSFPIALVLSGTLLVAIASRQNSAQSTNTNIGSAAINTNAANTNSAASNTNSTPANTNTATVAAKVNLAIPFTSQAPYAVWDPPHNEGCEEASTFMVAKFWLKEKISGPEEADKAILAIEKWETEHLGYWEDTNAADTVKFINGYWPTLSAEVKPLSSMDDVKRELSAGNPVIIPTNGRLLGNPYYTSPGPRYHMLVMKGYDSKGFITNDSGTRRGADYRYSGSTVFNAAHDWQGHEVADGAKVYILIRPKA
jgi:hypothetical protein